MLFRRPKSPEKPVTEMAEDELERDIAQCDKAVNKIVAKREKERSRTTFGFVAGFKALGLIGGVILLAGFTGSLLVGFGVCVTLTGALIYRSLRKEQSNELALTARKNKAGNAMQYFKNMRTDPAFKSRVLDTIAGDFNAGAKEKIAVSKPLTYRKAKPGLFR